MKGQFWVVVISSGLVLIFTRPKPLNPKPISYSQDLNPEPFTLYHTSIHYTEEKIEEAANLKKKIRSHSGVPSTRGATSNQPRWVSSVQMSTCVVFSAFCWFLQFSFVSLPVLLAWCLLGWWLFHEPSSLHQVSPISAFDIKPAKSKSFSPSISQTLKDFALIP